MTDFQVTRAQLKNAYALGQWDLLDKLLSIDNSKIDDKALFTDTWGEWWGLLFDSILHEREIAVRILLSHGADPTLGNWGDCIPQTPKEAAVNNPAILALLENPETATYERKNDPDLPTEESAKDGRINAQGKMRDETGLVFPNVD